jgi:predicted RNase H-like HicB family nuclease
MNIEFDRETDGGWIAKVAVLRGVLAHGNTRDEALRPAWALALQAITDRIEHGNPVPDEFIEIFSLPA